MNDITLNDFLLLFCSDIIKFTRFNLINTDNKSFPKEFRRKYINPASFFAELYKADNNPLLDRKIKFIALLPADVNIDKNTFDFNFELSLGCGFMKILNDDNIYEAKHLCPVIHIVLYDEVVEDETPL